MKNILFFSYSRITVMLVLLPKLETCNPYTYNGAQQSFNHCASDVETKLRLI